MIFTESELPGTYLVDLEKREDERGFFARSFCRKEFEAQGLEGDFVQMNASLSVEVGTLRGMHYQLPPAEEVKLVRCIAGALWDVVLDLRRDSPTFGRHVGAELSAQNRRMMYVPRGCAHGFLTLEPNSEVLYMVSAFYAPQSERGVRWDDPAFAIDWPQSPSVVSERDRGHPDFDPAQHLGEPAP